MTNWQDSAACVGKDPEIFFHEKHEPGGYALARSICERCPVRSECLEFALTSHERYGVWGGLTPDERKRYKRGELLLRFYSDEQKAEVVAYAAEFGVRAAWREYGVSRDRIKEWSWQRRSA